MAKPTLEVAIFDRIAYQKHNIAYNIQTWDRGILYLRAIFGTSFSYSLSSHLASKVIDNYGEHHTWMIY